MRRREILTRSATHFWCDLQIETFLKSWRASDGEPDDFLRLVTTKAASGKLRILETADDVLPTLIHAAINPEHLRVDTELLAAYLQLYETSPDFVLAFMTHMRRAYNAASPIRRYLLAHPEKSGTLQDCDIARAIKEETGQTVSTAAVQGERFELAQLEKRCTADFTAWKQAGKPLDWNPIPLRPNRPKPKKKSV